VSVPTPYFKNLARDTEKKKQGPYKMFTLLQHQTNKNNKLKVLRKVASTEKLIEYHPKNSNHLP
jgi:hypothetical protein